MERTTSRDKNTPKNKKINKLYTVQLYPAVQFLSIPCIEVVVLPLYFGSFVLLQIKISPFGNVVLKDQPEFYLRQTGYNNILQLTPKLNSFLVFYQLVILLSCSLRLGLPGRLEAAHSSDVNQHQLVHDLCAMYLVHM